MENNANKMSKTVDDANSLAWPNVGNQVDVQKENKQLFFLEKKVFLNDFKIIDLLKVASSLKMVKRKVLKAC